MAQNTQDIRDMTLSSVAPALEADIQLDQSLRGIGSGKQGKSLLEFLEQYHAKLLKDVCAVDLTVYEYGLEGVPSFHLVGPSGAINAYRESVNELTTPEPTSRGDLCYSIALNPEFRERNSLKVITLPPLADDGLERIDSDSRLVWESYPLPTYNMVRPEYPKLDQSLQRFRALLSRRQDTIRSCDGRAIRTLLCCNFTLPELRESGPLRAFGQLFLGLSTLPFNGPDSLRPEVADAIRDLGFLLYRGGSASLLLGTARDSSRATFAHEAKKLVQLIHDWPARLENYFDVTEENGSLTAFLKARYIGLRASELYLVLLPDSFFAATNQMLTWTMADSVSDLPFYDADLGAASLPSTFRELLTASHEASVKQCILSFLRSAGSLHVALLGMRRLDQYLQTKMPSLSLAGSAIDSPVDWRSSEFVPRLVDFSRLIMVIFREAIQHGSWNEIVSVHLEVWPDGRLDLIVTNGVRNGDAANLFADAPKDLPLQREDLEHARTTLHAQTPTFSPVGRQGRRQISFLADSSLGELIYIGPKRDAPGIWTVNCRFGRASHSQRRGESK